jgi:hypothetical protein
MKRQMLHMYTFGDSTSTPTGGALSVDYEAFTASKLDPMVVRKRMFDLPHPSLGEGPKAPPCKTRAVFQTGKPMSIQINREVLAASHLSEGDLSTSFPGIDVIAALLLPPPAPPAPPSPPPSLRQLPQLSQMQPKLNPSVTKTFPQSPFDFGDWSSPSVSQIRSASETGCFGNKCRCQKIPVLREFVSCRGMFAVVKMHGYRVRKAFYCLYCPYVGTTLYRTNRHAVSCHLDGGRVMIGKWKAPYDLHV